MGETLFKTICWLLTAVPLTVAALTRNATDAVEPAGPCPTLMLPVVGIVSRSSFGSIQGYAVVA